MIWEKIISFISKLFDKKNSDNKGRIIVICTAVFSVVLAVVVIMTSLRQCGVNAGSLKEQEQVQIHSPIPADELFIPEEPDFVPDVMFDRERREIWTEDDVLEFWNDPLREGEEPWRRKFDAAIEEMLERIP